MRRVATAWIVIESILSEHSTSIFRALRGAASMDGIRRLEELISAKLPQPLLTSLLVHDGMKQGVDLFDDNRLLSVAEIGQWWSVIMDNPWDNAGPKWSDAKRMKGDLRWRPRWLPFSVTSGGDLLAIDLDPGPAGTVGQVFKWHNYGSPPPKVVARSYRAWLDTVAWALIKRQFTLDKWGGIQLRGWRG